MRLTPGEGSGDQSPVSGKNNHRETPTHISLFRFVVFFSPRPVEARYLWELPDEIFFPALTTHARFHSLPTTLNILATKACDLSLGHSLIKTLRGFWIFVVESEIRIPCEFIVCPNELHGGVPVKIVGFSTHFSWTE